MSEKTDSFQLNGSQQRLLLCIKALSQADVDGLSAAQICTAVGSSACRVHHDLRNLQVAGFASRIESTGRWALGGTAIQMALDEHARLQRISERAEAIKSRYTR